MSHRSVKVFCATTLSTVAVTGFAFVPLDAETSVYVISFLSICVRLVVTGIHLNSSNDNGDDELFGFDVVMVIRFVPEDGVVTAGE
jgi:hypothetical protein